MAAANDAAARTELGLTALATTTPGTGVAAALGVNVGSAGAFITFNGNAGTPSALVGTNISGTAASLTAGAVAVGGITGLGTGVATFLATPSSANLASAVTGETGSGALVFGTSPTFTTSVVTDSTTLACFNTVATTVNAFGATTTLNIGASAATVLNFGGFTSAAELRFLEPSGSGTNYSGLKQPALAASITYLLPSDAPANGDVLTSQSNGTLSWETPSGSANAVTAASTAASAGLLWVSGGADRTATATDTVDTLNATNATVGSIVAGSSTIALLNTVATTINFGGVATALNIGAAAATVMNFGGHTSSAEMRFLEPSGSGTNYIGFKAVAMGASTTYTWPATAATAGQVLTAGSTPTALEWTTPAGGGTVTVVGAGSLTSTAFVTGGGTTTLQTPSTTSTLDSSGNAVFVGSVTGTRFIPSGSTIPTNGMYLPAANTLGWGINSSAEMQLTGTALSPAADGGLSLGTTALGWQDLHSNTGFVWNIENGNWVATHTSGILTVGTGDLRITAAGTNAASAVTVDGTQTLGNKTLTKPVVDLGVSLSSDDTYTGLVRSGLNNSGGVTQWDAVYLNGSSQWVLADANGSSTYPCRGLAVATVSTGNATTVLTRGTVRNDSWTWTPGGTIYLSTTAGGLTQTAPSTTGDKVQVIGYALDADTMAVEISPDYGTV